MQWQTIDTAPRDGTVVLLWGGRPDHASDEVRYDVDAPDHDLMFIWDSSRPVTGWYEAGAYHGGPSDLWRYCSYDSGLYGDYENPTHWASLPPPPAAVEP